MLRPEQKPILLIGFISRKFMKGGDMVPDPFMGTGATAKACFLDLRYRNFAGFDADNEYVLKMMPSFWHIFVEQVLNRGSEVTWRKAALLWRDEPTTAES